MYKTKFFLYLHGNRKILLFFPTNNFIFIFSIAFCLTHFISVCTYTSRMAFTIQRKVLPNDHRCCRIAASLDWPLFCWTRRPPMLLEPWIGLGGNWSGFHHNFIGLVSALRGDSRDVFPSICWAHWYLMYVLLLLVGWAIVWCGSMRPEGRRRFDLHP